jgi:hypothetical protein
MADVTLLTGRQLAISFGDRFAGHDWIAELAHLSRSSRTLSNCIFGKIEFRRRKFCGRPTRCKRMTKRTQVPAASPKANAAHSTARPNCDERSMATEARGA